MSLFERYRKNDKGSGLVGVMTAAFVFSIALVSFLRQHSQNQTELHRLQQRQDLELLRRYVRAFTSCTKTMEANPPGCSTGETIEVRQVDGKPLIAASGSRLGQFEMKAHCQSDRFQIQYKAKDTEPWKDLFRGIPIRCGNGPAPASDCAFIGTVDNSDKDASCALQGGGCGIPGQTFREGGHGLFLKVGYRVPMESLTVKVTAEDRNFEPKTAETANLRTTSREVSLGVAAAGATYFSPASREKASQLNQEPHYLIPFPEFVPPNDWEGLDFAVQVDGKVAVGSGKVTCRQKLSLWSPIVLDLSGGSTLRTVPLSLGKVTFDLDADGTAERVGWVAPPAMLLVRDLNRNGIIDDGRELFGQATRLRTGVSAPNGYEAMKDLDLEERGFLDDTLPVFQELQVWRDKNVDGKTDSGELESLAQNGITKLSLDYGRVTDPPASGENPILYHSRFFGPEKCGKLGCRSYDVFFLTAPSSSPSPSSSKAVAHGEAPAPAKPQAGRFRITEIPVPGRQPVPNEALVLPTGQIPPADTSRRALRTPRQFGQLPELPAGYAPSAVDSFVPLVNRSGTALPGIGLAGTEITTGGKKCRLAAHSPLYLVGQRRDLFVARPERPCDGITEGYVPSSQVRVATPMPF